MLCGRGRAAGNCTQVACVSDTGPAVERQLAMVGRGGLAPPQSMTARLQRAGLPAAHADPHGVAGRICPGSTCLEDRCAADYATATKEWSRRQAMILRCLLAPQRDTGADGGLRSPTLPLKRRVLCHLSYIGAGRLGGFRTLTPLRAPGSQPGASAVPPRAAAGASRR